MLSVTLVLLSYRSVWEKIALAPRDPIISIAHLYEQDPNPSKINLSIGTYRTEQNTSCAFTSVRKAEELVFAQTRHIEKGYSPMEGFHLFNQQAYELLFGREHYDKEVVVVVVAVV